MVKPGITLLNSEGVKKISYKTVRVPPYVVDNVKMARRCILNHGVENTPRWAQEILLRGKKVRMRQSDVLDVGIITLRLLMCGKSVNEIRRMTPREVEEILGRSARRRR